MLTPVADHAVRVDPASVADRRAVADDRVRADDTSLPSVTPRPMRAVACTPGTGLGAR